MYNASNVAAADFGAKPRWPIKMGEGGTELL